MANTDAVKWLSVQVVEFIMNTINSFQNYHHLPRGNSPLHHQPYQCKNLPKENANLRNKQSNHPHQSEENTAVCEQIVSQSSQSQQKPISSEMMSENHQPTSQDAKPKQVMVSDNPHETEEDAALRAEVAQYREQHAQLYARYQKLNEEMKRKKIDSFEALAEYDKDAMKVLIELARFTQPIPLEGNNVGLFGLTSTGKSTMLNALLDQKVAETGVGETTTKITPYKGSTFTLWDVPGRNDEVSYLSMEYISFFKGLSRRLILIQATVKENSGMMKLLDEIGLRYAIVLNKFDKVEKEEQADVQKQIESEVEKLGLKGVDKVFFVSAKHPNMFPDWMAMIKYLEDISI